MIMNHERISSSYNKTTIRAPNFLLGHLRLICALLSFAPKQLPEEPARIFALECVRLLATYRMIIERLCFEFPEQAYVLLWFQKCLVLAFSVACPIQSNSSDSISDSYSCNFRELFAEAKFIENGIYMLVKQISENPLPQDMLPTHLPSELKKSKEVVGSSTVTLQKDGSRTWWDVLDVHLKSSGSNPQFVFDAPMGKIFSFQNPARKWDENMFQYSILGSEILFMGLKLVRRSKKFDLVDTSSLARSLFYTAFAARTVGSRLEDVRWRSTNKINLMDTDEKGNTDLENDFLAKLAYSLARCTEELLILCNNVCEGKENLNQVAVAIKSSGLDSRSLSVLPEERQEFLSQICKEILSDSN
jgi:hypothetical protein